MKWKDKLIIVNGNRTLMKLGINCLKPLSYHLSQVRKNGMIDGDRIIHSQYNLPFSFRIYLTIQRGSKFFIKTFLTSDINGERRVVEDCYYALN